MNVHYISTDARAEILEAAVEDARAFFEQDCMTIWDLCDCIEHSDARDAVEDLVALFSNHNKAPEKISATVNRITFPLMMVPFSVVEMIETKKDLNGGLGNAIK